MQRAFVDSGGMFGTTSCRAGLAIVRGDLQMRRLIITTLGVGVLVILFSGCETIRRFTGIGPSISTQALTIDFRPGEQLVSTRDSDSIANDSFRAARIMTAPSDATQGQAEVILANGTRRWSRHVLESRKATPADLYVGRMVLYMRWSNYSNDRMTQDTYRNSDWNFGRVTSVDQLFRGRVEVAGRDLNVNWVRVTDALVE